MNSQALFDSIVRQTTVLIAQLATAGGVRAPLAHMANQVFLELTRALHDQNESSSQRARSLGEAVLAFIAERPVVTRQELLERFARDEPLLVRGAAVYRALCADELTALRGTQQGSGFDELLWVLVYRELLLTREALAALAGGLVNTVDASVERLLADGRNQKLEDGSVRAPELYVPLDAEAGWEAAVFDHYHALVKTIRARLARPPAVRRRGGLARRLSQDGERVTRTRRATQRAARNAESLPTSVGVRRSVRAVQRGGRG